MKIAETAQDSQSHGLRLLSANEDGDGDSSSSEYEGSSDDEETSEEEALIKKAKVDDRKRDRRVDSSPSKSDAGKKRRLESSPSKSEDERKKKQKKDQDRGKGKDREGERSRDPTVSPRAWSPGLYTAGASPESKKKEEKRQKMEKLKRQRERRERREEAERKRKEDEASDVIEIPSTAGSFIEIPSTGGTGAAAWPSTATSAMGTAGAGGSKARKVVVSDSDSDEDVPVSSEVNRSPVPPTDLYGISVDRATADDKGEFICLSRWIGKAEHQDQCQSQQPNLRLEFGCACQRDDWNCCKTYRGHDYRYRTTTPFRGRGGRNASRREPPGGNDWTEIRADLGEGFCPDTEPGANSKVDSLVGINVSGEPRSTPAAISFSATCSSPSANAKSIPFYSSGANATSSPYSVPRPAGCYTSSF